MRSLCLVYHCHALTTTCQSTHIERSPKKEKLRTRSEPYEYWESNLLLLNIDCAQIAAVRLSDAAGRQVILEGMDGLGVDAIEIGQTAHKAEVARELYLVNKFTVDPTADGITQRDPLKVDWKVGLARLVLGNVVRRHGRDGRGGCVGRNIDHRPVHTGQGQE